MNWKLLIFISLIILIIILFILKQQNNNKNIIVHSKEFKTKKYIDKQDKDLKLLNDFLITLNEVNKKLNKYKIYPKYFSYDIKSLIKNY